MLITKLVISKRILKLNLGKRINPVRKMPSEKEVKLFRLYSSYAAMYLVIGVDWHPKTGKLIPTKSKFKLMLHYLFLVWMFIFCIFCLHRNFNPEIEKTVSEGLKYIFIFITISYCAATSWFICFALFRTDLANFWSQLILICSDSKYLLHF